MSPSTRWDVRESRLVSASVYSFEIDPYRARLECRILAVGKDEGRPYALLDDTVCFPEGGGQPCDRGWLGDAEIVAVRRVDSEIRHYLDREVEPGKADLILDWEKRFDHMQQHTAQHLLSSQILARLGWQTRSFHIGPEVSDIEIGAIPESRSVLDEVEDFVAGTIRRALPISSRRVDPEVYARMKVRSRGLPEDHRGDIRLVEIEGVDLNTCGGTHVRSTAEVESFKILRCEPLRGGTRMHWIAGGRVRRRLGELEDRALELRRILDTADQEVLATVERRLGELHRLRRRLRELELDRVMTIAARELESEEVLMTLHLEGDDAPDLWTIGEKLREELGTKLCFLTAEGSKGPQFALVAGERYGGNADEIGKQLCRILAGRGGGRGPIFQGRFTELDRRREAIRYLRAQPG